MENRLPIAITLSSRDTQDKDPGSSSTVAAEPLLDPGEDEDFEEAVNDTMRTDGKVNSISSCGSGLLGVVLLAGRLVARRGVCVGVKEEAMVREGDPAKRECYARAQLNAVR